MKSCSGKIEAQNLCRWQNYPVVSVSSCQVLSWTLRYFWCKCVVKWSPAWVQNFFPIPLTKLPSFFVNNMYLYLILSPKELMGIWFSPPAHFHHHRAKITLWASYQARWEFDPGLPHSKPDTNQYNTWTIGQQFSKERFAWSLRRCKLGNLSRTSKQFGSMNKVLRSRNLRPTCSQGSIPSAVMMAKCKNPFTNIVPKEGNN